jgi:hypothetical protein
MRSCEILNENYMKNKDIMEWMLDEGIDPLITVTTEKGEIYLSDILEKHLTEQLRIHDVVKSFICDAEEKGGSRCETQCLCCDGFQRESKAN